MVDLTEDFSHLEGTWIDVEELQEFAIMYAKGDLDNLFEGRKYNNSTGRNYKKDYEQFQSSPQQIADRSSRNKARRKMLSGGKVRKGDGKDVDHKNGNPQDNRTKNLRVISKSKNRGDR
jgi:hypothetical protein